MRIVIAGAGKLGYSIAQLLASDQFDVVVIEQDAKRRELVQNSLDVLTVDGNSCSPLTYDDPDIRDSDVFIACTDSDEVNMISCLMAKNNGIAHTVARIRNVEYKVRTAEMLQQDMKVDLIINPESITATEIEHIILTPAAMSVEEFAGGKIKMFEAKLRQDSPYAGVPLMNLTFPKDILVAMAFRRQRMIIPRGDTVLQPNDNVYFVGMNDAINEFEKTFVRTNDKKIEKVMIVGAGRTGRFLAPALEKQGLRIKVVEKDKERCELMSARLNGSLVLCGDGTDLDFMESEGAAEADVVVCITEDEKLNLLIALLAKHLGAKKTIVRVARNEYVDIMEKVGVDVVLSSRLLSAGEVLRFIRKGGLVSVSLLEGAQAEAIEIVVNQNSPFAGHRLRDIKLPKECLLCGVSRNNEAQIPNGNTVLNPGDHVIIFVKTEISKKTIALFEGA